jgi:succinoglycan biosynthesis protein ExoA
MRPDEDLLIVIPTLDEQRRIVEVIETLRSDPACARALIVVADGGSKDRTLALVKELASKDENLEMIDASPRGIPGGINLAVRMFGGSRKLLVRIDAHAQYPKHYVSRLINTLLAERADLVVVRMRAQGETCFEMAAATAQNTFLGTGGAPHRIGARSGWVDHGHHALFLLGKFMGIGGYDEFFDNKKLRSAEDVDFDARLCDSGGRIWLANDIEVTYFPHPDGGAIGARSNTLVAACTSCHRVVVHLPAVRIARHFEQRLVRSFLWGSRGDHAIWVVGWLLGRSPLNGRTSADSDPP